MVKIIGYCHPVGNDESYDGPVLKKSEMALKAKQLIGKPLEVEHSNNKKIGKVLGAVVDKDWRLLVCADIDENTEHGKDIIKRIKDKKMTGLSLGTYCKAKNHNGNLRIFSKDMIELSVTDDPNFDDTRIKFIEMSNKEKTDAKIKMAKDQLDNLKQIVYKQRAYVKSITPDKKVVTKMADQDQNQNIQQLLQEIQELKTLTGSNDDTPPSSEKKEEPSKPVDQPGSSRQPESEKKNDRDQKTLTAELEKKQQQLKDLQELQAIMNNAGVTDPKGYFENIINSKKRKLEGLKEGIVEYAMEEYRSANKSPNEKFMKGLEGAHKFPFESAPLFEFLSVAHNNKVNSIKAREQEYNKLKEQMENERKAKEKAESAINSMQEKVTNLEKLNQLQDKLNKHKQNGRSTAITEVDHAPQAKKQDSTYRLPVGKTVFDNFDANELDMFKTFSNSNLDKVFFEKEKTYPPPKGSTKLSEGLYIFQT
jgi:hypothetical protein